jgi:hypothetical protein
MHRRVVVRRQGTMIHCGQDKVALCAYSCYARPSHSIDYSLAEHTDHSHALPFRWSAHLACESVGSSTKLAVNLSLARRALCRSHRIRRPAVETGALCG